MFSNLSQGSPIYILSLKDSIKCDVCPIVSMSVPRPLYPTYTQGASMGLNMGTVVDIAVTLDGKRKEFTGVPTNSAVSSSSDFIITDSKEAMISQVDSLLQSSKQIVESVDKHKSTIVECEEILKKLNPSFAKEAAVDSAISQLTERVNTMQNDFNDIRGDMKQMLSILTGGNKTT